MINIPIKSIGLISIFLLIGIGIGYGLAPIRTEIRSITTTKIIEKSGTTSIETVTSTIQIRKTITKTVANSTTTINVVNNSTDNSATSPPEPKDYVTVFEIEGENETISENFYIPTASFKVVYTITAKEKPFLGLFIYRAGEETVYEEMILEHNSATKAKIIKAGPGDFYLNIKASNVKYWIKIQVEN